MRNKIYKKILSFIAIALFLSIATTLSTTVNAAAKSNTKSIQNAVAPKLYGFKLSSQNGPDIKFSYKTSKKDLKVQLQSRTDKSDWADVKSTIDADSNSIEYNLLSSETSYKFRIAAKTDKNYIYSNELSITTQKNMKYTTDAFTYTGSFKTGVFNGSGVLLLNDNTIFADKKFYTLDQYEEENPTFSAAALDDNYEALNGKTVFYSNSDSENNGIKFEGTFENGEIKHGTTTLYNGMLYDGDFADYEKNGEGVVYKTKGTSLLKGNWEKDGYVINNKDDVIAALKFCTSQDISYQNFVITLKSNDAELYKSDMYSKLGYSMSRLAENENSYNYTYKAALRLHEKISGTQQATLTVLMLKETPNSEQIAAIKAAKDIIAKIITPAMGDLEKELTIHNYIVNNTKYDTENRHSKNPPDYDFTAYGVLVNKKSMCQGYAEATKLLLDTAGMESYIVLGNATSDGETEGHAWNIVRVNGNYYHLDTTWDDPTMKDGTDELTYNYFNLPDDVMYKDHTLGKDENVDLPKCTDNRYSYFWTIEDPVISNGYMYYCAYSENHQIYRISLDGSQKSMLVSVRAPFFIVSGNLIYYSNYDDGGYLYRYNIDTNVNEQISDMYCNPVSLDGNLLTYKDQAKSTLTYTITK